MLKPRESARSQRFPNKYHSVANREAIVKQIAKRSAAEHSKGTHLRGTGVNGLRDLPLTLSAEVKELLFG
jgi:hypothetical protein